MKLIDNWSKEDLELISLFENLEPEIFKEVYEELEDEIKRSLQSNGNRVDALREQQKKILFYRCATDIELFALTFFSHYIVSEFNAFHLDAFKSYKFGERDVRRADCAPRGFAKSTIKAVIKPIHDICYRLERFIVVVSNTKPQAIAKLKDIKTELQNNDLLIDIYGTFFKGRVAGTEDFVCHSGEIDIRVLAVGSGTEIRGARYKNFRPSKIICDDVEHSSHVESEEQREKMESWFKEVISKIGNKHTNIEFVGTVIHQKSLLKYLLNNPRYESREYKAIISWSKRSDLWEQWTAIYTNLDDEGRKQRAKDFFELNKNEMLEGTEVLWPSNKDYYSLQEEIIEIGMRSFQKEMQNNPLSDDERPFSQDNTSWCELVEDGVKIVKTGKILPFSVLTPLGVIDPATGQTKPTAKKKADYTCILSCYYHPSSNRLFVVSDYTKRVSPSAYISAIFDLHDKFGYFNFGVEYNLYRELLMENIRKEQEKRYTGINEDEKESKKVNFYEITQTENKHKRIYTIEPKVYHGNILLSKDLSPEFFSQLWDFPFSTHDDCCDALEMAWNLATGKYSLGGVKARPRLT